MYFVFQSCWQTLCSNEWKKKGGKKFKKKSYLFSSPLTTSGQTSPAVYKLKGECSPSYFKEVGAMPREHDLSVCLHLEGDREVICNHSSPSCVIQGGYVYPQEKKIATQPIESEEFVDDARTFALADECFLCWPGRCRCKG